MTTIVYRYGLLPPADGADIVRDQMLLAHRYYNVLIEIERGRRAAHRAALSRFPSVSVLEVEYEAARANVERQLDTIRALRSKARGHVGAEGSEERAKLKSLRTCCSSARTAFDDARKLIRDDPWLAAERARIDEVAAGLKRNARAHCAVYWGTYLLIEAAADAAAEMPLYDRDGPADPHFAPWEREGQVSVQLQGGLPGAQVFGAGRLIRIKPVDELAWHSPVRGERRRLAHTVLTMRIGSDATGGPVWGQWPMVMHRALPPDAVIKRAIVSCRLRGPREEWSLDLTIETERARPTGQHGAVAIDIGWRLMPGGIRVASWVGEDGARGEFRLSDKAVLRADGTRRLSGVVSGFRRVEDLTSIRDKNFKAAAKALLEWLGAAPDAPVRGKRRLDIPEWLTHATRTLGLWESPARLAALARRWRDARFAGDDAVYGALETWRYHDHHLWRWQEDMRIKVLRRRREEYRVLAAQLARHYSTLVLEVFDLRAMARRAPVEAPGENPHARWQRHVVALSELRAALCNAFRRGHGTLTTPWPDDVDCRNSTRECSQCHHVASFHAADSAARDTPCPSCGAQWDQDQNAAQNLLDRWRERQGGAPESGPARSSGAEGSKWSRKKARKTERGGGKAAARKSAPKAAE